MKAKLDDKIKTANPNNNLRARSLASPSSRAASSFVLASKLRKIPQLAIWVCSMLSLALAPTSANPVSALTYSEDVGVNFTFNPSLSVSLSSASGSSNADLVINDLTPGTSSDSNIIDVNVLSNNANGYVLNSSVGNNSTYSTALDNLVHSDITISSTSPKFTNLTTTITSPSDFNDNTWGYTYSLDNGTTWINAHETIEGTKDTGYNGLPLYSSSTPAELNSTTGPSLSTGDIIKFKIAAKASTTQASGEYNNVINFTVVGNTNPVSFYDAFKEAASKPGSTITTLNGYYKMQDMTPAICNAVQVYDDDSHIQLIDIRDHEVYYIGKLRDDRCWLLDNLRLGSNDYEIPLTPEDTNIATNWALPRGITSGFNSYTEPNINAAYKNDTNVTSYGTASGKVGVYYNYCATSGGTYCYDENSGIGDAEYDICPTNWRMPTGGGDGEYQSLCNAYYKSECSQPTSMNPNDANSIQYALSLPNSGHFSYNSRVNFNVDGHRWSSTNGTNNYMYNLGSNNVNILPQDSYNRVLGFSIRCITNN